MEFNATFNCHGKVNSNDWKLSRTSFVHRTGSETGLGQDWILDHDGFYLSEVNVGLFDRDTPASSVAALSLSHFAKCTEMQLQILNRHESNDRTSLTSKNNNEDFYEIRKSVCDFASYVRVFLFSLQRQSLDSTTMSRLLETEAELDDVLLTLRRFFARLRQISDSTFHYVASSLGNKCSQPEFHLYHTHLELRWLFVTIIRAKTMYLHFSGSYVEELDDTLQLICDDLVYISMKMFERLSIMDLRLRNPYSCTCARELWLMMQIFLEDAASQLNTQNTVCKTFWEYVNSSLDKVLATSGEKQSQKRYWHCEEQEKELPRLRNPELFAAWLIYHLALLHGYDRNGYYEGTASKRVVANYEGIDRILKGFVSKGGKDGDRDELDEELCVMIPLIRVLVDEWWPTRVQIISFLWDCFHRRLEQPFLLQTSGPWSASMEKKSPADILRQIHDRIDGIFDHSKESSYGMFLRFLGTFVRRVYDKNDTRQWNQVKGRIYSKFSKNKVEQYSEAGLYNFISLFLTLAVTADTTNVCTVLLDLLPSACEPNDNGRLVSLCWKGKLAVLLVYSEKSLNLESIAGNLTNVVNAVSCRKDENARTMMASFVDTFGIIVSTSENLDNGEHIFVGGWIDRYLLECSKNRIGALLKTLVVILEKCARYENPRNDSGIYKILDALWSFVASRTRQLVFEPPIAGENYVDVAKLGLAFTSEALRCPTAAKRHKHSAASLFQHFASTVTVKDVRITKSYITRLLRNDRVVADLKSEVKNFDLIVIQAWVKCCVLGLDSDPADDDARSLRNRVSSIPEIQRLFATQAEISTFEIADESIFIFLDALMKFRNSLQSDQQRYPFDSRVRLYFTNIDKWALASISHETKETKLAFSIYKCVGSLILYCSPIFYIRNQPINALRTLVSKFILPGEQSPQASYLKLLGKRIFSMILRGIETLSPRSDLSLQALIRDLFEAYLPLLVTENSGEFIVAESLLRCLADVSTDFCRLIVEKLAASFIIVSGDNSTHKHCYLVMLLLRSLLKSGKSYGNHVVDFVVGSCAQNVISCYFKVHDHHPHKQQTLDFLDDITNNSYYREDSSLRDKFQNSVVAVLLKFLTFHSQSAFDLLRSISRTNVEIVDKALPQIEKVIADLEKSRRPNAAALRFSLTQLRNARKNI